MSRIKSFFESRMRADTLDPGTQRPDVRLAACALLLELAYADDTFTAGEREQLRGAVGRQFGLDPQDADELIALAEQARADGSDLWPFTSLVKEHYSSGQKAVLLETMRGLVYADGTLAAREDELLRRISDMVGIDAGYLAEVRRLPHELGRDRGAVD